MGYRLNLVIVEGLPSNHLEDTIKDLKFEGSVGLGGKHFTLGETKKLGKSLFDDKLRIGFYNGCTLITSNLLVEDFFRPFLTQFSVNLTEVFPGKKILFISTYETINWCTAILSAQNWKRKVKTRKREIR